MQEDGTQDRRATPKEKRQLVEIVSSNRVLKDGSIGITYRKPFDLLAASTSEEKWWTLVTLYRTFFLESPGFDLGELGRFATA
jgi:hypothetical protein